MVSGAVVVTAAFGALRAPLPRSRGHGIDLVIQLVAGVGEVLEQLHLAVKVDDKGLVPAGGGFWIGRQHQLDEFLGSLALAVDRGVDAAAGVDEQAEAEGQVALGREALDDLRTPIFGEREILGGQIGDKCPVLVDDRDGKQNFACLHLDRGHGFRGRRLLGREGTAQAGKAGQRNGKQ